MYQFTRSIVLIFVIFICSCTKTKQSPTNIAIIPLPYSTSGAHTLSYCFNEPTFGSYIATAHFIDAPCYVNNRLLIKRDSGYYPYESNLYDTTASIINYPLLWEVHTDSGIVQFRDSLAQPYFSNFGVDTVINSVVFLHIDDLQNADTIGISSDPYQIHPGNTFYYAPSSSVQIPRSSLNFLNNKGVIVLHAYRRQVQTINGRTYNFVRVYDMMKSVSIP